MLSVEWGKHNNINIILLDYSEIFSCLARNTIVLAALWLFIFPLSIKTNHFILVIEWAGRALHEYIISCDKKRCIRNDDTMKYIIDKSNQTNRQTNENGIERH